MSEKKVKSLSIYDHFKAIEDPRIERMKLHQLEEMLIITICAVICGAEGWVAVEEYGLAKLEWFKKFLTLENGIPSHDTFGRVFSRLNPSKFSECFTNWVQSISEKSEGEIVAIDGKTLRRSFDKKTSKSAIHMVSAWSAKNHVVLGQVKTEEKSNEITAIPKLLELLDINGCLITIDAMGCQKQIAADIIDNGANYVLALKGNQETLHDEVKSVLALDESGNFSVKVNEYEENTSVSHGRIEKRRFVLTGKIKSITNKEAWKGLKSVGMVESVRVVDGKATKENRYFICSLPSTHIKKFAEATRLHWQIENNLHWTLDVSFREDECRIRKDHSPENLAVVRHIAVNLLKNEKTAKVGIANKRLKAGWDDNYLLKVLGI